jgi:hypothetical protein
MEKPGIGRYEVLGTDLAVAEIAHPSSRDGDPVAQALAVVEQDHLSAFFSGCPGTDQA